MKGKDKQPASLTMAFEALVSSHLLTAQQLEFGKRIQLGEITCVHYDYAWEGERYKADFFYIWGIKAVEAAAIIAEYGPAESYKIFVVVDRPGLVNEYMVAGFSPLSPGNYLMAHSLESQLTDSPSPDYEIHQATSPGDTILLNVIEEMDLVRIEDILDPNLQYYYISEGQWPVAVARNGVVGPGLSWVSHVYTNPEYRGQGRATALMKRMMADRREAGDKFSLLLATETAHGLYQRLGYQDLAGVLNFHLPVSTE